MYFLLQEVWISFAKKRLLEVLSQCPVPETCWRLKNKPLISKWSLYGSHGSIVCWGALGGSMVSKYLNNLSWQGPPGILPTSFLHSRYFLGETSVRRKFRGRPFKSKFVSQAVESTNYFSVIFTFEPKKKIHPPPKKNRTKCTTKTFIGPTFFHMWIQKWMLENNLDRRCDFFFGPIDRGF